MEELKNQKIEYEKNKNSDNEREYNRQSVDNIKRFIMMILVAACAIPFLFCIYLTIRINRMESKLEEMYNNQTGSYEKEEVVAVDKEETDIETANVDEDKAILDQDTNDDLEISVSQNNMLAASSEEDGDAKEVAVENGKKVYLTFDDGPSIHTEEILDILKKNNVKATFFVVYNEDKELWPMYQRIVDEGHTLGMHSYSHVYELVYDDLDSFKADVSGIHDFLLDKTGVDSHYYRFPGGSSNSVSNVDIQELIGYLNEKGMTYYDWNSLSGDAVNPSVDAATLNASILQYVRNNEGDSIVLMHDIEACYGTVEGLQDLIDTLKDEGYSICAIDDETEPVQHVSYKTEGTE